MTLQLINTPRTVDGRVVIECSCGNRWSTWEDREFLKCRDCGTTDGMAEMKSRWLMKQKTCPDCNEKINSGEPTNLQMNGRLSHVVCPSEPKKWKKKKRNSDLEIIRKLRGRHCVECEHPDVNHRAGVCSDCVKEGKGYCNLRK